MGGPRHLHRPGTLLVPGREPIHGLPPEVLRIGIDAKYEDAVLVEARQVQIRERVLVRLGDSDFYLGPEVGLNRMARVRFSALEGHHAQHASPRRHGHDNPALGAGFIRDTRHNPLNVRDGFFGELAFLHGSDHLISDYRFTNTFADIRKHHPIVENVIWANQFVAQAGFGDLPFNELSVVGGDSLMRGYYMGRYRDAR